MQFFRFFVSNVRIRASVLLFSSINRLLFPSLLQNYEAHTQAITKPASKKQDAGSVSGSNARTRAPAVCSKLRHGLVPDIQSAAEPCDHDRHLLARGAALRLKAQAARARNAFDQPQIARPVHGRARIVGDLLTILKREERIPHIGGVSVEHPIRKPGQEHRDLLARDGRVRCEGRLAHAGRHAGLVRPEHRGLVPVGREIGKRRLAADLRRARKPIEDLHELCARGQRLRFKPAAADTGHKLIVDAVLDVLIRPAVGGNVVKALAHGHPRGKLGDLLGARGIAAVGPAGIGAHAGRGLRRQRRHTADAPVVAAGGECHFLRVTAAVVGAGAGALALGRAVRVRARPGTVVVDGRVEVHGHALRQRVLALGQLGPLGLGAAVVDDTSLFASTFVVSRI